MLAIGLFGGSFDPIHNGHLQVVHSLHTHIPFTAIRLIPCAHSPGRPAPIASGAQRIEMLKRAAEDIPWLSVEEGEIARGGVSYTIDTLRLIRKELPHATLSCIMSMDQFLQFHRWKDWEEIPTLAHIVVTNRLGYLASFEAPSLQACLDKRATEKVEVLHTTLAGAIFFQQISALPISSTQIRARLHAGKEVSDLLPKKVYEYISQEKLYLQA